MKNFRNDLDVGTNVQAEYTEDGKTAYYDAVIEELLYNGKFLVYFPEYGNKEEVDIGAMKFERKKENSRSRSGSREKGDRRDRDNRRRSRSSDRRDKNGKGDKKRSRSKEKRRSRSKSRDRDRDNKEKDRERESSPPVTLVPFVVWCSLWCETTQSMINPFLAHRFFGKMT